MMFQKATSPVEGEYDVIVVADSISPTDHRITTLEVTMPRIILAEFNTHRMFTRNSASSRAIPFRKMVEMVMSKPFVPIAWMKDHTGMQGNQYFGKDEKFKFNESIDHFTKMLKYKEGDVFSPEMMQLLKDIAAEYGWLEEKTLNEWWLIIRTKVVQCATLLYTFGVTKQVCNRLLEPFMWHKVLVTSTEWENFSALRFDPAAEIHMQYVAEMMLDSINFSTPEDLRPGMWHIPYGSNLTDLGSIAKEIAQSQGRDVSDFSTEEIDLLAVKIATARCAQVSYTLIGDDDKPMDYAKLIGLHDRLSKSGHWSPFEHCARCMGESEMDRWVAGKGKQRGWCGNFRGWYQYRKMFDNENRTDSRIVKKHYGAANQKG